MGQQRSPKQLSKFINYILGHRPDEFGLIPDPNGFVKIKELLKALCEEDGWRYVRRSHLNEILVTLPDSPIEIKDNFIRAKVRDKLTGLIPAKELPKLLYTGLRNKAYPFVLENGIRSSANQQVVLSSKRDMAERIGKRIDSKPVMLTVQVQKSLTAGVVFYQSGDLLYAADFIPAECFQGPPLPKQKVDTKKQDEPEAPKQPKFPGSFFIDPSFENKREKSFEHKKKRKEIAWKKDLKRMKRRRQEKWPAE
ncbi:MAG: RNA 2'-phosphotransferase [Desulfobacterales bacterium]|nr:RNA 2'-phosphotransferase [Desulfobacterales bacterium]